MGLKIILHILIIFMLSPIQQVFGNWTGPVEVVIGSWGSGAGQFGMEQQDSGDFLPRDFGVDKGGIIIIADKVNNRIQLFKPDGSAYKIINRPTEIKDILWPWTLNVLPDGNSFLAELSIFDYTGAILSKINIKRAERYATADGYIIYNMDTKAFSLYSPTGQIIKTSAERPAELGKVNSQRISEGQYKSTITYLDAVYQILADQPIIKQYRDSNKNIYQIETFTETVGEEETTSYKVHKYNKCSKRVSTLNMGSIRISQ